MERFEILGRFVGGSAHELNNALAGITGYAGLLAERFEPESDEARYLAALERAAQRGIRLAKRLLELSQTGEVDPRVEPVSPQTVLEQAHGFLSAVLERRYDLLPLTPGSAQHHERLMNRPRDAVLAILEVVHEFRAQFPAGGRLSLGLSDLVFRIGFEAPGSPPLVREVHFDAFQRA